MNISFCDQHSQINFTVKKFFQLLSLMMLLCCTPFVMAEDDFLDPEQAFKVSASMVEPGIAEVNFTIADGYYLYRERFKFVSDDAKLGTPDMPAGKVKFDETFQKNVETYRKHLTVRVPVQASGDFTLKVTRQGCADQGLCYPPMETAF
ncbi:MAG: protein-disulfide reductase DsbD N-terminal domain-containing protein, partial [Burkholderiales bacterium]|nr:protein-disulfide reductase DsbD N-terminal domain-containing protein [Burkholderiales bacterium]